MTQSITPAVKEFAPFAYFVDQSSALVGFGGSRLPPDPRYCFHTEYKELEPGIVNFEIWLDNAHATHGEITIRIHAYRPDSGLDIALVNSIQFALRDLKGQNAEIRLRIAAIPSVQYAAYGYLSEPSDLTCTSIRVHAEQIGGESADSYAAKELGPSAFGAIPTFPLKQVVGDAIPCLSAPQSQPITHAQLTTPEFVGIIGPVDKRADLVQLWREAFALRALQHFNFLQPGSRGLLINDALALSKYLREAGCHLICHEPNRADNENGPSANWAGVQLQDLVETVSHADFALSIGTLDQANSYTELIDAVNAILRCLLKGGIAVFLFNYWPDRFEPPEMERFVITETVIRRIALHVISHGSSIVQLLMPKPELDLFDPAKGWAFGLIAIR